MADYSADDFTNGVNTALIEDREMWKEKGSAGREGKGKITEYGEVEHRLMMRKNRAQLNPLQFHTQD